MELQSNFTFLSEEFPILCNVSQSAEYHLYIDPSASVFKLRKFGEKLIEILFKIYFMDLRYTDSLLYRIRNLKFENVLPDNIASLLTTIRKIGNLGVHLRCKLDHLLQTILAKAFLGELMSQLSGDGNAKKLLEKIKNLREEEDGKSKKKNNG